jgi:hypothetical protein
VHRLSSDRNVNTTYGVSSFILHPNYNQFTLANDIALIKLDRAVTPSDKVNFICVEKNVIINPNDSFVVVGWGFMLENNSKKLADILMQVTIPNLSTQQCLYSYDPIRQICAGDPDKTLDSCKFLTLIFPNKNRQIHNASVQAKVIQEDR